MVAALDALSDAASDRWSYHACVPLKKLGCIVSHIVWHSWGRLRIRLPCPKLPINTKGRADTHNGGLLFNVHLAMAHTDVTLLKVTLLEYLRQENLQLECSQCQPGSNSRPGTSLFGYNVYPDRTEVWDDFELAKFDAAHNGTLKAELDQQHLLRKHPVLSNLPFREVHDEKSLEAFLILWTWQIVSEALAAAQRASLEVVYMVHGGQSFVPQTADKPPLHPDWGAVQRPADGSGLHCSVKGRNILPGDTKLSSKWSSTSITIGKGEMTKDAKYPISQIYKYCCSTNSRYGYLITDKELVVVRIDMESLDAYLQRNNEPRRRMTTLHYKAIPWRQTSCKDPELLTVNLVLWMLHLVAAREGGITSDEQSLHQALTAVPKRNARRSRRRPPSTPAHTVLDQGAMSTNGQNMSFSSVISDTRHLLSDASIGNDGGDLNPTRTRSRRKRGLNAGSEEEILRGRSRSSRNSKRRL